MKLTAFTAGRPGGNSEIYAKAALMAAEAKGVEVELIRLTDCDLHNCRDCGRKNQPLHLHDPTPLV